MPFMIPTFEERDRKFVLGVFFYPDKFGFLDSQFWRIFVKSFVDKYCCPELKPNKNNLWLFFVKLCGF